MRFVRANVYIKIRTLSVHTVDGCFKVDEQNAQGIDVIYAGSPRPEACFDRCINPVVNYVGHEFWVGIQYCNASKPIKYRIANLFLRFQSTKLTCYVFHVLDAVVQPNQHIRMNLPTFRVICGPSTMIQSMNMSLGSVFRPQCTAFSCLCYLFVFASEFKMYGTLATEIKHYNRQRRALMW